MQHGMVREYLTPHFNSFTCKEERDCASYWQAHCNHVSDFE